ncbi:MAG: hypothetical protein ACREUT_17450 [Steroidobacteraceae bacterium]
MTWHTGLIVLLLLYVAIALLCTVPMTRPIDRHLLFRGRLLRAHLRVWVSVRGERIAGRLEQFEHWRACRAERRFRQRMRRYWERHPLGKWDRTCRTDAREEHETFGPSRYA